MRQGYFTPRGKFRHVNTRFNLPIGVNFVNMFGMPQNTCIKMFILHKFYLFIYLMSADIRTCTDLYLQVVIRSELFDKNTVMRAVRILIHLYFNIIALIK